MLSPRRAKKEVTYRTLYHITVECGTKKHMFAATTYTEPEVIESWAWPDYAAEAAAALAKANKSNRYAVTPEEVAL